MKLQLSLPSVTTLFALSISMTGCVSSTDDGVAEADDGPTVAAGDGDGEGEPVVDGDGDTTPVTGTGGTPTVPVVDEPLPIDATLPMVVTDFFGPSGFMGAEIPNDLAMLPHETEGIVMDEAGCVEEDRVEGAAGVCFSVVYTPQYIPECTEAQLAEDPECTGATWAGVFFQNPSTNWGELPGAVVEQGATKMVFTAWTAGGEQEINVLSGGIGTIGSAYADTYKTPEQTITLTPTPTQFEISLVGQSYEMVLGAFAWTLETNSMEPIAFFLDDMRWVKE